MYNHFSYQNPDNDSVGLSNTANKTENWLKPIRLRETVETRFLKQSIQSTSLFLNPVLSIDDILELLNGN